MSGPFRPRTAIALFTRDLRVHDNPVLATACETAQSVVPLFVLHQGLGFAVPNRMRFLHGCLADLREGLRQRGGDLVIRRGDPVAETLRLAGQVHADVIVVANDVSRYARDRHRRLAAGCLTHRVALRTLDAVTIVPPGTLVPAGGDHYKVFTPYWRAWSTSTWRPMAATPTRISPPPGVEAGALPPVAAMTRHLAAAEVPQGGETAARRRMRRWLSDGLVDYLDRHDDLPADATSRLSADLHFGCLSALELAVRVSRRDGRGARAYLRQLCWRDFHAQVAAAFGDLARRDYRPARHDWRDDADALHSWREGHTGYPVVDAGMRQLAAEGFLPGRARLLTAAYLTRHLGLHWTEGARTFFDLLVDGDIANNAGNWQWVAGTGNDTRPNRRFNLVRQALRYDPNGDYVRRHVRELASIPGSAVHRPWMLADRRTGYPAPLTEPPTR